LKFGDIITHNDNFYIFLAQKDDGQTYYFAKIISDKESIKKLTTAKENYRAEPRAARRESILQLLTCFVVLTSDDFNGDVAHLGNPDSHLVAPVDYVVGAINIDDAEEIKQEILENPHVLPPALLKAIREISEPLL